MKSNIIKFWIAFYIFIILGISLGGLIGVDKGKWFFWGAGAFWGYYYFIMKPLYKGEINK